MAKSKEYDKYNKYIARLEKAFATINKIEDDMEEDLKQLSIVDKEVGDYLHIIEAEDTIKNPDKFLRKLRDLRRRRREIKVTIGILKKLRQLSTRMSNRSNRQMLIAELHKEVKNQLKDYNFRVLEGEESEGIYKPTDDEQTE